MKGSKIYLYLQKYFVFFLELHYFHHYFFNISLKVYTPQPFDKICEDLMWGPGQVWATLFLDSKKGGGSSTIET